MDKRNADTMLLDSIKGTHSATFYGIDWGRKDFTAVNCPRCHEVHRWRLRIPKRCRHCGLTFCYTAANLPR